MFELKVVTRFAAAHQLKMVSKKCESLHGHNWRVEIYVAGDRLDKTGVLMDFGEIKKRVSDIMKNLDHKFLNELDIFHNGNPPSSENIARYVAEELQNAITDGPVKVTRVTAWESEDAGATYIVN